MCSKILTKRPLYLCKKKFNMSSVIQLWEGPSPIGRNVDFRYSRTTTVFIILFDFIHIFLLKKYIYIAKWFAKTPKFVSVFNVQPVWWAFFFTLLAFREILIQFVKTVTMAPMMGSNGVWIACVSAGICKENNVIRKTNLLRSIEVSQRKKIKIEIIFMKKGVGI